LKQQMTSSQVQILGFVAGTLTTFAFVPQVLHTWRTGGRDLSWSMLSMFGGGVALWIVYGVLVAAPPIIVANGLTILQIAAIVAIKWRLRLSGARPPQRGLSAPELG
jgi:MtN3 and saliva related transmembrane protein